MRKALPLVLVIVGLLVFLVVQKRRANEQDGVVIGVSMLNMANEFIVSIKEAMESRAQELGVRLIINDGELRPEKQIQQIESFIARGVDAIILNPCEVEACSPAVDKAIAAKIPIVNVNSETRSAPTAFVGSRDEESAEIAIGFLAEKLGGKGKIVMIAGNPGQAAEIKRGQGAKSTLAKHPEMQLIAEQTADWRREKGMALMENWLQAYKGQIDAVFAQNDEMGMGAVSALEAASLKDQIPVVSVDAIADALQAVKDGRLDATVFQNAKGQGGTAVETALKIVKGEPYEKEVFIPFELVTAENVDDYLETE